MKKFAPYILIFLLLASGAIMFLPPWRLFDLIGGVSTIATAVLLALSAIYNNKNGDAEK